MRSIPTCSQVVYVGGMGCSSFWGCGSEVAVSWQQIISNHNFLSTKRQIPVLFLICGWALWWARANWGWADAHPRPTLNPPLICKHPLAYESLLDCCICGVDPGMAHHIVELLYYFIDFSTSSDFNIKLLPVKSNSLQFNKDKRTYITRINGFIYHWMYVLSNIWVTNFLASFMKGRISISSNSSSKVLINCRIASNRRRGKKGNVSIQLCNWFFF